MQMALAWPMCRYPFGSGGKRVCTRPLYLFVLRSSMKRSRMKLEGRDSGAGLAPVSVSAAGVVIIFDLTAKERRRAGEGLAHAATFPEKAWRLVRLQRRRLLRSRSTCTDSADELPDVDEQSDAQPEPGTV